MKYNEIKIVGQTVERAKIYKKNYFPSDLIKLLYIKIFFHT